MNKRQDKRRDFLRRLRSHTAELSIKDGSTIASGAEGESLVDTWRVDGIQFNRLPDDPNGILRISVGGGDHLPEVVDYCSFRGDREQCLRLLRKVISGLEKIG